MASIIGREIDAACCIKRKLSNKLLNNPNLFVIAMCHLARHHLTRQNNRLIIFLHLVTTELRRHHPSLWLHPTFAAAIKTQNQLRVEMRCSPVMVSGLGTRPGRHLQMGLPSLLAVQVVPGPQGVGSQGSRMEH